MKPQNRTIEDTASEIFAKMVLWETFKNGGLWFCHRVQWKAHFLILADGFKGLIWISARLSHVNEPSDSE